MNQCHELIQVLLYLKTDLVNISTFIKWVFKISNAAIRIPVYRTCDFNTPVQQIARNRRATPSLRFWNPGSALEICLIIENMFLTLCSGQLQYKIESLSTSKKSGSCPASNSFWR